MSRSPTTGDVEAGGKPGGEPELRLLRSARVRDLVPDEGRRHGRTGRQGRLRWEASGVVAADGQLYVVFDDTRLVAVLDPGLRPAPGNRLIAAPPRPDPTAAALGLPPDGQGYEDLAHDPVTGRFYLLVEALPRNGGFFAAVEEYDPDLAPVARGWLDRPLPTINKGMEGLTLVRRDGQVHLLALCEGNLGLAGAAGERGGGGRVEVYRRAGGRGDRLDLRRVATVDLPAGLAFRDYSAIAVRPAPDGADAQVAVVSQRSAQVWLGRLAGDSWRVQGPGTVYSFPRDVGGRIRFGTVEGVTWLDVGQLAVVCDRARRSDPVRFRGADRSVHVLALPGYPGG